MRTLSLLSPTARLLLAPALVLALSPVVAPPAGAGELKGVTMPDSMTVADATLKLNGMGLRTKFFVKVYVAGLYLPEKVTDGAAVLAADTPRHMEMHFLYDVDTGKLCEAWTEGLAANTPGASAELKKDFATLCGMMADMEAGQTMAYTYVPGEGTTVSVRGSAKGTIEGRAFADALFACWLGPKPPNEELKDGLLGG